MASGFMITDVKVKLRPGYEKDIYKYPQVKGYVSRLAGDICSQANSLGSGFRTKKCHIDGKEVGGTQPKYGYDKARESKEGCIALVHPKNYAAMKDNHLHNTLLKSMRKG